MNIHMHGHKVWIKYQQPVQVSINSATVKNLMRTCTEMLQNNTHYDYFTALDACVPLQYACMRTNNGVWHFVNPVGYISECMFTKTPELCSTQYNTLTQESNRLCLHENARRMQLVSRQKFINAQALHPLTLELESRSLSFEDAIHFQILFELLHDGVFPCNERFVNSTYCTQ